MAGGERYLQRVLPIGSVEEIRPFFTGFIYGSTPPLANWGDGDVSGLELEFMTCLVTLIIECVAQDGLNMASVIVLLGMFDGWRDRRRGRKAAIEALFDELTGRRLIGTGKWGRRVDGRPSSDAEPPSPHACLLMRAAIATRRVPRCGRSGFSTPWTSSITRVLPRAPRSCPCDCGEAAEAFGVQMVLELGPL